MGASTTVGGERNNAGIGAKVSVGPQIGAKVGGGATVEDGKLTVGADVKLALGVGITLQPSITVDTRPAKKAVVAVTKPVAAAVTHTATAVNNTAKKTGKAIKKGAKKLKFW